MSCISDHDVFDGTDRSVISLSVWSKHVISIVVGASEVTLLLVFARSLQHASDWKIWSIILSPPQLPGTTSSFSLGRKLSLPLNQPPLLVCPKLAAKIPPNLQRERMEGGGKAFFVDQTVGTQTRRTVPC
jgi:hypothetical protein